MNGRLGTLMFGTLVNAVFAWAVFAKPVSADSVQCHTDCITPKKGVTCSCESSVFACTCNTYPGIGCIAACSFNSCEDKAQCTA